MNDVETKVLRDKLEQAELDLRVMPLYRDLARAISDYFEVPNVVLPTLSRKDQARLDSAQERIISCLEQLVDVGLDPRKR